MKFIEKSGDILNPLIKVNMDRVEGFEHASKELKENDVDLIKIFREYKEESRNNIKDLRTEVNKIGAKFVTTTNKSNVIQRNWCDVKWIFNKNDRKSVLRKIERCEDSVKKTYRDFFLKNKNINTQLQQLLSTQEVGIFIAHDTIKCLSQGLV